MKNYTSAQKWHDIHSNYPIELKYPAFFYVGNDMDESKNLLQICLVKRQLRQYLKYSEHSGCSEYPENSENLRFFRIIHEKLLTLRVGWQYLSIRIDNKPMKLRGQDIFRLSCITLLWLALCYLMIAGQRFNLRVAFILIASGIIVFVPLYKKYFRSKDHDNSKSSDR